MNESALQKLHEWYTNYVDGFSSEDKKYSINIDIKKQHTRRVCHEIIDIGNSLNMGEDELRIADAIALLHDIGRFSQYDTYGTYSDLKSEDHAQLGIKVIKEHRLLFDLDENLRDMILRTIGYHNKRVLPQDETDECLFFTKLLRDADKLDIFKVVTDYYCKRGGFEDGALGLDLSDSPHVSNDIIGNIEDGKTANREDVKTMSDLMLLQMSWVYDINFDRTRQLIEERNYIGIIYDHLPRTKSIEHACQKLLNVRYGDE